MQVNAHEKTDIRTNSPNIGKVPTNQKEKDNTTENGWRIYRQVTTARFQWSDWQNSKSGITRYVSKRYEAVTLIHCQSE